MATCQDARQTIQVRMRPIIFKRDEHKCVACGDTVRLELCHFFPLARSLRRDVLNNWDWLNSEDNLVTLCWRCHDILDDRFGRLKNDKRVQDIVLGYGKDLNRPSTWTEAVRKQLKRKFENDRNIIIAAVANYLKIPVSTFKWYQGARYS
jgi:hypothetical protein